MKVLELLTLMGTLSVGNDNVTPTERAIFLQYLNLAHLELYQGTANFNQDLLVREDLTTQKAENRQHPDTAVLSKMPYLVSSVYDVTHKGALSRLSVADVMVHGLEMMHPGAPLGYIVQRDILTLFPAPVGEISLTVWYIPQPPTLTEAMEEKDIPYPVACHPVLADGALYYLFQEEGGFKSVQKENEARKRWEAGKSKLLSYLYGSGGQTLSTFSSV